MSGFKYLQVASLVAVMLVTLMADLPGVSQTANAGQSTARRATATQVIWHVVASGGGHSSSATVVVGSTIGQTGTGLGRSKNFGVSSGFWQDFGTTSCCTAPTTGDVDATGSVDISDLTAVADYLFSNIQFPGTCFLEQDVDKSGAVDISDLSLVVDYLFGTGTLPSCP